MCREADELGSSCSGEKAERERLLDAMEEVVVPDLHVHSASADVCG